MRRATLEMFAAAALTGIIASEGSERKTPPEEAAQRAYEIAQAMMTERSGRTDHGNPLPAWREDEE